MSKKNKSLKTEVIIAVLLSVLISLAVFGVLEVTGEILMDHYFSTSDFIENAGRKSLWKLEKYVERGKYRATDTEKLDQWVAMQRTAYISIVVYRNGEILYDGAHNIQTNTEEERNAYFQSAISREITFRDGPATVYLMGLFDYQFYIYAIILEILISFVLFFLIFTRFIQKKIDYIRELEEEIKLLETGGMAYEITVSGNDELARLAEGLNQMRITLKENMEKGDALVHANNDLVVRVAHDLRTPLTALLLYLDLLNGGQITDSGEQKKYIEKSRNKAIQIKQMSDRLFERFLISQEKKCKLELPCKVQLVFEDLLSEMVGYLMDHQFEVETDIRWTQQKVSVSTEYVGRILDNISSNIIKYADYMEKIKIAILSEKDCFVVLFLNKIKEKEPQERKESTGVGVQNICIMMERMGGSCQTHQNGQYYILELRFPVLSNNTQHSLNK